MMTFVDTSGWFASIVPTDPRHADVLGWLNSGAGPLLTTDYVIDETLTLLRSRREHARAVRFGRQVFDLNTANVHFLTPDEISRSWELFRNNPQRDWSFTDCTSKVTIDRFHVKQVLAFDSHFAELGAFTFVP